MSDLPAKFIEEESWLRQPGETNALYHAVTTAYPRLQEHVSIRLQPGFSSSLVLQDLYTKDRFSNRYSHCPPGDVCIYVDQSGR